MTPLPPDKPYSRLKAKVTGVLGPRGGNLPRLRVPFPGVSADACGALQQGACPLQPGQEYVYRANIPVNRAYPSVSIDSPTNRAVREYRRPHHPSRP